MTSMLPVLVFLTDHRIRSTLPRGHVGDAWARRIPKINARRRRERGEPGSAGSPSEQGTEPSLAAGSGVVQVWTTAREDRTPETGLHREKKDGRWGRGELGSALPASGT